MEEMKKIDPRGVPPMVVEGAIKSTKRMPGNKPGTWKHIAEDVQIILNDAGDIITVIPKKLKEFYNEHPI